MANRREFLAALGGAALVASTRSLYGQQNPEAPGATMAGDGYIQGRTLELEPHSRIVQAWRSTEFPDGSPDSRVEVILEATDGGTRLILRHSDSR